MPWYAKPSGYYSINSDEAKNNMFMIRDYFRSVGWSDIAIAGMLGNVGSESGYNPWRWQGDTVNYSNGYGLVQFTAATYYIGGRGLDFPEYAPNLSTSTTTASASPDDGTAQLKVIEVYHNDKFLDRRDKCDYADLSDTYPYSSFKVLDDLWIATVGWLFNYEYPAKKNRTYEKAMGRYSNSQKCYEIITGSTPPTPPHPPTPPIPPHVDSGTPLYLYTLKRYKQKKGTI